MSDIDEKTRTLMDEEERKRLILEIGRIKDVLDSFKYGLNFEEFADEIFKTINRQTIVLKQLSDRMGEIQDRMARLETRFDEGIKLRVASIRSDGDDDLETQEFMLEEPVEPEEPEQTGEQEDIDREELAKEAAEIELKIAKLFEKENEYLEMGLNDPASVEEYEEKGAIAKNRRLELEAKLNEIKKQLDN